MAKFLKLVVWNANSLIQHRDELKIFLYTHDIDLMLISETHFTEKNYIHIPQNTLYHTNHPARTHRGGTAIIHVLKSSIQHHPLNPKVNNQAFLKARHHRPPHNISLPNTPYIKINWKNTTASLTQFHSRW
jgi:exonuclease III